MAEDIPATSANHLADSSKYISCVLCHTDSCSLCDSKLSGKGFTTMHLAEDVPPAPSAEHHVDSSRYIPYVLCPTDSCALLCDSTSIYLGVSNEWKAALLAGDVLYTRVETDALGLLAIRLKALLSDDAKIGTGGAPVDRIVCNKAADRKVKDEKEKEILRKVVSEQNQRLKEALLANERLKAEWESDANEFIAFTRARQEERHKKEKDALLNSYQMLKEEQIRNDEKHDIEIAGHRREMTEIETKLRKANKQHQTAQDNSRKQLVVMEEGLQKGQELIDQQNYMIKKQEDLLEKQKVINAHHEEHAKLKEDMFAQVEQVTQKLEKEATLVRQLEKLASHEVSKLSLDALTHLQSKLAHAHTLVLETIVLKKHEEEAKEADLCVVCLTEPKTHVLIPCGHKIACKGCANKLKAKPCPVCREVCTNHLQVFG